MSCVTPCGDCSDDCTDRLVDMEDFEAELTKLRARTKEVEETLAKLHGQKTSTANAKPKLRSSDWFDRKGDPTMSALYAERYLNQGLTREELTSGMPIIGICQSGSDITPCNRHHLELAKRIREGIRSAGGIAFEFPMHPIQESSRRPTATSTLR